MNTAQIITFLNPIIGYKKTTELVQEARKSNKNIIDLLRSENILTDEQIDSILDPFVMSCNVF
jgi:aspartate ammonia-lyase